MSHKATYEVSQLDSASKTSTTVIEHRDRRILKVLESTLCPALEQKDLIVLTPCRTRSAWRHGMCSQSAVLEWHVSTHSAVLEADRSDKLGLVSQTSQRG